MDIYEEYLFKKHYLVNYDNHGKGDNQLETMFALANLFGIRIVKGREMLSGNMIKEVASELEIDVPEPFYRGFPQSVRELSPDQLFFDQLIHYVKTYGLGDFSEAGHSLFEDDFERTAFKENARILDFTVITWEESIRILTDSVNDLLAGTRPLNNSQYALVVKFLDDYMDCSEVRTIASKNTCVKLIMDLRNLDYARFIALSDVIKYVDELNYMDYDNRDIRKLNLRNKDRKFITKLIDTLIDNGKCDLTTCYEKKSVWNGLLHHIHYVAKNDEGRAFVNAMRGRGNKSAYSAFEEAMARNDIRNAVDGLMKDKGSSMLIRKLDYIVSRCRDPKDMEYVVSRIDTKNALILMQLLLAYSDRFRGNDGRIFRFTKYNMIRMHFETAEEKAQRKSHISKGQREFLCNRIENALKQSLKNRLGRVYIDPDMVNYALPIQENTSQSGLGVLAKGSRIHIPEGKKVRAFTYWEQVNDIDLSCFGINRDGSREEFSWRTMSMNQSDAITFSGDQTSGYNGGSEYFDIDINKLKARYPDMRYMIFCDNVYSDVQFDKLVCRAGYMLRDVEDSGQVYEPKTVDSSFTVNCQSTFAYLFGIDLLNNDFVWINAAMTGRVIVAGTTDMDFVLPYFEVTRKFNVYSFFEMMATEEVSNISEAEVVVTDKTVDVPENVKVIREYDFDTMIGLMNRK